MIPDALEELDAELAEYLAFDVDFEEWDDVELDRFEEWYG